MASRLHVSPNATILCPQYPVPSPYPHNSHISQPPYRTTAAYASLPAASAAVVEAALALLLILSLAPLKARRKPMVQLTLIPVVPSSFVTSQTVIPEYKLHLMQEFLHIPSGIVSPLSRGSCSSPSNHRPSSIRSSLFAHGHITSVIPVPPALHSSSSVMLARSAAHSAQSLPRRRFVGFVSHSARAL
ncbi:hypothetical protein R3P38DRAFT_3249271 [Favolaschia claudopus]|uniref:Uncharacterized protein n=1 Tax=Favolaschia claudopus TaxID=2862362 RepID=A0AAW0EDV0_9AGAR